MVQAETVTSGKLTDFCCISPTKPGTLLFFRLSNGGFYPQRLTAEFSRHYVGSLRHYEKGSRPADYVRPKTTKGARDMSRSVCNSIAAAQSNPYMRS